MKTISYYLQLIRIQNLMIATLTVLLSSFLLGVLENYFIIFICALVVSSIMASAYIMNDLSDIQADKTNNLKRV